MNVTYGIPRKEVMDMEKKKSFLVHCSKDTLFKIDVVCAFLGVSRREFFIEKFFDNYFKEMCNEIKDFKQFYEITKEMKEGEN